MTAGLAAFIWSYFPNLTAQQVKEVIEKSAVPPGVKVVKPVSGDKVELSDLSKTGAIINAYEAVKLARQISEGSTAPEKQDKKTKKAKAA